MGPNTGIKPTAAWRRLGGAHAPVRPILLLAVRPVGAEKASPGLFFGVNAGLKFLRSAGLKFAG